MSKQSYHVTVEPWFERWHICVIYYPDRSLHGGSTVFDSYADTPEEAERMANGAIDEHKERRRIAERNRKAKLAQTKTWTVKGNL